MRQTRTRFIDEQTIEVAIEPAISRALAWLIAGAVTFGAAWLAARGVQLDAGAATAWATATTALLALPVSHLVAWLAAKALAKISPPSRQLFRIACETGAAPARVELRCDTTAFDAGQPVNRALLIGINAYPSCPLQYCVNDLDVMGPYLWSLPHGPWEINRLTDRQATTEGILYTLRRLVGISRPGDRLLFHYSGHGAYTPDELHPVICPVDFDWTPEHWIEGRQIVNILAALPEGVHVAWVSDSCHSGGLDDDRGVLLVGNDRKVRRVKSFARPAHILAAQARASVAGRKARGFVDGELDCGFVAGCAPGGTSADNGLTPHLVRQLAMQPIDTPLAAIVKLTAGDLAADGLEQIPEADGARANEPFLGGSERGRPEVRIHNSEPSS
jgi:hypothetical protein